MCVGPQHRVFSSDVRLTCSARFAQFDWCHGDSDVGDQPARGVLHPAPCRSRGCNFPSLSLFFSLLSLSLSPSLPVSLSLCLSFSLCLSPLSLSLSPSLPVSLSLCLSLSLSLSALSLSLSSFSLAPLFLPPSLDEKHQDHHDIHVHSQPPSSPYFPQLPTLILSPASPSPLLRFCGFERLYDDLFRQPRKVNTRGSERGSNGTVALVPR